MLLTHEIYGSEFNRDRSPKPFELRTGQMRVRSIVHNGGWYNGLGERLGWGDLSEVDLQIIARDIPEGEAFYILFEGDSFWNFVKNIGVVGGLSDTRPEISKPGIEYVKKFARFRITKDRMVMFRSRMDSNLANKHTFDMRVYQGENRPEKVLTFDLE